MDSAEGTESPSDWERVKDLLLAVQEDPPEDLDAWLDTHCSEPAIREEVGRLVRASAAAGDFLEGSASERYLGVKPPHPARIGRYRIIEELGSGGLGVVYAAQDDELQRPVALKVLRTPAYSSAELRKRLRWDARAACSLHHPNIVTVHDIGQDQGFDYMVMERVQGDTLNKVIPPGGLDPSRAVRIALRIVEGLEAAHAANIVHRDLKPGNVMIGDDDAVKLLDFGLAKPPIALTQTTESPETIEGRFAGTAAYVSPEQAEGKQTDARGDIFSFGCVLFEMLTGRQAFEGQSAVSVVARILEQEPPKLATLKPDIDPRLSAIVHRCLRKNPAERFQNVAELKERLAECATPLRTPIPRLDWRHAGWEAWCIAAGVVIVACLATWLSTRVQTEPPPLLTRLSGDGYLNRDPAISPDGKFVAYASDRDSQSNLDIFVQDTKSGEATRVTFGPANAYEPVFSPDGGRLVFRSDESGGGLYTIPTIGGRNPPRLLAAGGRDARFSPDGESIAFWTGEAGAALLPGAAQAMYIPSSGGEAKPIATNLEVAANPVWDPSGRTLLCIGRAKGEDPAWQIVDFEKHIARPTSIGGARGMGLSLREPAGSNWYTPLAWLPDQTVLTAARQGDANNIWGMRVSSEGKMLEPLRRFTGGTALETHMSAAMTSSGERTLVYDGLRVTTTIRKVELTAAGTAAGEPQTLLAGYGMMGRVSLNADGSKLAFPAVEPMRKLIYLMDVRTRQIETVTNRPALKVVTPMLSGDGAWLVYFEYNKGYVMSTSGGTAKVVCEQCGLVTDVNGDASAILFESGGVTNELFACSRNFPQKPVAHVVDAPSLIISDGRWSGDHRWILFGGTENRAKAIYLAPVTSDGNVQRSQLRRISEAGYDAWTPVWSKDGRYIYFFANADGYRCIFGRRVAADGNPTAPAFPVVHFHKARESATGPLPSPNDFALAAGPGFLVFNVAETIGEVWMRQAYTSH